MRYRFELVEIEKLREHESTTPQMIEECLDLIKEMGGVDLPILVEENDYIILDGHHRFKALQALGCKRAPAYLVDYASDEIEVGLWPGAAIASITKEDVIRMGLSGELYPTKTTRHQLKHPLPKRFVPLSEMF
ncbi:MAG: ParB N-terminal domain-containing protein [Candidatus Thermoplasmatota archaeon]